MGWVSFRVILSLIAGIIGVGLFIFTEITIDRFYEDNRNINLQISTIELNLNRIENEILKSSVLLYYNYDPINREIESINNSIKKLYINLIFKNSSYKKLFYSLQRFRQNFEIYYNEIERFLSLNSSIKNSIIYIHNLQLKAFNKNDIEDNVKRKDIILLLAKISTYIYLIKNALDPSFIPNIVQYQKELKTQIPYFKGDSKRLLEIIDRHLSIFIQYFPYYFSSFRKLMNIKLKEESNTIFQLYQEEAKHDLNKINYVIRVILILYLLSLIIVIYFIFKTEKDYKRFKKLHNNLKKSYITDSLTGMKNREAFKEDKKEFKQPALLLLNIDRFQHINDFYGIEIGDKVLQRFAKRLIDMDIDHLLSKKYRFSGDEFAILYDRINTDMTIYEIAQLYYEKISHASIEVDGIDFDITVTIGASKEEKRLIETADIALKYAKKSKRKHIAIFDYSLDNRDEIEKNIKIIKSIKDIFDGKTDNTIITHYQPILNIKTGKIDHYEALARISHNESNNILLPSEFLDAMKMAKMSGMLTIEILKQVLESAKESNAEFGINISAEDIYDTAEKELILQLLKDSGDTAKKIVFEILESEDITDYDKVIEFIATVKKLGSKIAIDDFGSGYSNFERILKLDIDFLKIDGSLIKRLDYDLHAELTVETIVTFAKRAGMLTVAEYVHNKKVLEKVKELDIDYAQGYFIGKPSISCTIIKN